MVILLGRVGRDPEIKNVSSDLKVANFSLATDESYKTKDGQKVDKVEWHSCQAWRGLAGVIEKYVKKGDLLHIVGRIQTRSWDKDDGTKGYKTEIVVEDMQMLGGKKSDGGSQGDGGFGAPAGGKDPAYDPSELPF